MKYLAIFAVMGLIYLVKHFTAPDEVEVIRDEPSSKESNASRKKSQKRVVRNDSSQVSGKSHASTSNSDAGGVGLNKKPSTSKASTVDGSNGLVFETKAHQKKQKEKRLEQLEVVGDSSGPNILDPAELKALVQLSQDKAKSIKPELVLELVQVSNFLTSKKDQITELYGKVRDVLQRDDVESWLAFILDVRAFDLRDYLKGASETAKPSDVKSFMVDEWFVSKSRSEIYYARYKDYPNPDRLQELNEAVETSRRKKLWDKWDEEGRRMALEFGLRGTYDKYRDFFEDFERMMPLRKRKSVEMVQVLKDEIHLYHLLFFQSVAMVQAIREEDLVTFYDIHVLMDKLGVFDSQFEKDVKDRLNNIEDKLDNVIEAVETMGVEMVGAMGQLMELTAHSSGLVLNALGSIDSSIKATNLLNTVQSYQLYRMGKKL